jgi:hypothetical protein
MRFIQHIVLLCLLIGLTSTLQAQVFKPLNLGVSGEVFSMSTYQDQLIASYAGYKADSLDAKFIARWDTINYWQTMKSGLDSRVAAMTTYNGKLYVGGYFNVADGKIVRKIAKWDGNDWEAVGTGIHTNVDYINALVVYKDNLYAGGRFLEIDNIPGVNNIARWDGSTWKNMSGVTGSLPEVTCMAVYKGELYVGGRFTMAGTTEAYNIARWDGSKWQAVGNGTGNMVLSMTVDSARDLLYVGGYFSSVDDTIRGRIATWDGQRWYGMGDFPKSIFGAVMAIEMYHNYAYVGCMSAKGLATDTVFARWDGKEWEVIEAGINSNVSCLKVYKDELYLGGSFTMIGSDSISYLARYYSPDTVEATVGIPTLINQNKLAVYPNPTKDQLIIQSELHFESFEVKDLSGKILIRIKKPEKNVLPVQALPTGVYILTAKGTDRKSYTARFVKE